MLPRDITGAQNGQRFFTTLRASKRPLEFTVIRYRVAIRGKLEKLCAAIHSVAVRTHRSNAYFNDRWKEGTDREFRANSLRDVSIGCDRFLVRAHVWIIIVICFFVYYRREKPSEKNQQVVK